MIGQTKEEKVLLLSIKPQYASKIFSGEKTVELRRTKPNLKRGDIVAVYVSSPVMALAGQFEVDEVLEREPEKLWSEVREESGIKKNEFESYYRGAEIAFGIKFKKAINFKRPVPLSNLRKTWIGFNPPQIYRYLPRSEYKQVLSWKNIFPFRIRQVGSYLTAFF